jgi:hypothetical protein
VEGAGKLNVGTSATTVGRLRALVDELGLVAASLYLIDRMVRWLSGGRARLVAYALYAQPIGTGRLAAMREDANTLIAAVAASDPICATFPRPAAVIRQRFDEAARCYVARVKGSFGGYIWISRERHVEDEVRCQYVLAEPDRSVWDFDVYVEPRLRLGRTLARLWWHVDKAMACEGVRWSFSRISLFNSGSLGAHQRLGAVRLGSALFLVLGPLQLALFSVSPFVHASWGSNPGPRIRLSPPNRGRSTADA